MHRIRPLLFLVCIALAGCGGDAGHRDVTPPQSGSGAERMVVQPLPIQRFTGIPTRIGFEPIPLEGGDFHALTDFSFLPDSNEFLAVNRAGSVGHFRLESNRAVMIDSFLIPSVYTGGDCSQSSLALDPEFTTNRLFYVSFCIDAEYSVIKRYTMAEKNFSDTVYSSSTIVAVGNSTVDTPGPGIGTLAFATDGMMWANIGDRGREVHAQDLTDELGKIIRLQPLKRSNVSGFTPAGAFMRDLPKSELGYAYGFRNPWRGAFDALGRYWIADIGAINQEINVVTSPGQNFGWPLADGLVCRRDNCTNIIRPLRTWDASAAHEFVLDDPLAKEQSSFRAAWVGTEYRPAANDPYKGFLTGKMLYGDFYMGFVRGMMLDSEERVIRDEHLGHIDLPVAWRQGSDGFLYVGTMLPSFDRSREKEGDRHLLPQIAQGQLWRVVPLP